MNDRLNRAAVQALAAELGEPGWLTERRLHAFEMFEKLELPDPKGNEWRYVDVRKFDFSRFEAPRPAGSIPALPADLAAKGVIFADLRTAVAEHAELLQEHFFTDVPVDEHKFTALHGAFFSEGFLVYVPRNVEVEIPLEVLHSIADGGSVFPHATIIVDENASATVVDTFRSPDAVRPAICSSVVEIEARRGSTVNYISLQQWGHNVHHFQTQRFTGHRDSTVRSLAVNLGSGFARTQVESALVGEGSFSEMLGLYFADADQHFSQRTLQSHAAEHTTSDLLYKGALKERSTSEYSGLIKVAKGAQGTDAYQANRNLVLSEEAMARSIPQLEIEANEVRCTHGATVSPVEEEHLFYLMSRGIDRITAQKLVVFGFFEEVLDRIRVQSVRDELSDAISKKVEGEQILEMERVNAQFTEVARVSEIPDGGMKQVSVRGDLVGLYRVGEDIYAMRDVCTHEEAYLTEGDFEPDELEVECPLHGSRFNVQSGEVRILPATRPEPVYPVRVLDDVIYIGTAN